MSSKKRFSLPLAILACLAMALFAIIPSTSHAEDFENPKPGAPKWKVVDYNRVQTHPARVPNRIPGGIAFDFLYKPDTALLGTSHPSYYGNLLGDMTGKTLTARVGVTVTSGTPVFTYYGQPDGCGRPANVRLYFRTDTGGKFEETDYWWSNPMSFDLQALTAGDQTLVANFSNPAEWSDFYGHYGNDPSYAAAFAEAIADVQFVGLSFGGGCFFENGIGIEPSTGSAYFRLMDFTAIP